MTAQVLEPLAADTAPVVIVVHGKPITQGSKTRTHYGMRDDNAKTLKPWREAVKTAGLEAMVGRERLTCPVQITARFFFDRPQSHHRTGRNAHLLRDSAPPFPANRSSGDVDKLLRSAFDALTDAGVWLDDSLVVRIRDTEKLWVGEHGLQIPGAVLEVSPA